MLLHITLLVCYLKFFFFVKSSESLVLLRIICPNLKAPNYVANYTRKTENLDYVDIE